MKPTNQQETEPKKDQEKINTFLIRKVEDWQNFEYVRPLVCKNTNQKLIPKIHKRTGRVCLRCPKSNYIQWSIPRVVTQTRLVVFDHARNQNLLNIQTGIKKQDDTE